MKAMSIISQRRPKLLWAEAALLALGLFSGSAGAVTLYAYGFDPITAGPCTPTAINDSGRMVGYCWTKSQKNMRAFISSADLSHLRDLGDLGGKDAQALDINDAGIVVGSSTTDFFGGSRAFITDPGGGKMRALDDPRALKAVGINLAGQIVGSYFDPAIGIRPFITDPGGVGLRDLGSLGGTYTEASAINSSGQVIGQSALVGIDQIRGFITGPNGVGMVDLGLANGTLVNPLALNDLGEVTGDIYLGDGTLQQFRTGPNGADLTALGTLTPHKAGGRSDGNDISPGGAVVGASTVKPRKSYSVATITDQDGRMADLNTWVVNLPPGVRLTGAGAINRHGQIAAVGSDGRLYLACPTERCKR